MLINAGKTQIQMQKKFINYFWVAKTQLAL